MTVFGTMLDMIAIQQRAEVAQISSGLYCRIHIFG